jgi:tetratricopeptide (TPR) repeat protein/tRNA A-37 threonylcarbamoyl transferase component Bud32
VSSPSWARIKPVVEKVLAAPAQDREGVIAAACENDGDLRRGVEEYLRHETSAQELPSLTEWPASPEGGEEAPPVRIGVWKILREIGRGGMGVIYLVERDDAEYRQTAALKLVRDSRRSGEFVDLFRHERQILAQLNHPNIASLLDGGATTEGRPYYVMEYVDGEPLTEYCRKRDLSVSDRIRLFLRICDAVSYAHRRLFIHRDLKPANILVTAAGEPKLLDFGLARVLDPAAEPLTASSSIPLLTPAYASPEQMRGELLTTATDVYSLGVILYELLADRLPFHREGDNLYAAWTAVCEQLPEPPSRAAPHGHRCRNAPDLDSIVLMTLRKEPEQRYVSVDAFADDLELYLAGMPVRARRGNALYRIRRFAVRRKWAALGIAAALAGICVSLGVIFREQHQAEMRFQELRRFAHSAVFELHDSIEQLPGSTDVRKLLVERSLAYLRSLQASSGGDASLKWELAEAYKRIGDAQGNPAQANLGDGAGALDSYSRARDLLLQITAGRNANVTALNTLAAVDRNSADILSDFGKRVEGIKLRREATEILQQVAMRSPTQAARRAHALSHYNLAYSLNEIQDWPAATREWQETLRLYEEIARAQPGDITMRRNVALSQKRLAAVYLQQEKFPEAIEHYHAAERIDRARLSAEPSSPEAKMDLSFDLSDLGLAQHELHRWAEAVSCFEEALALRRDVASADPHDQRAKVTVGRSLDRLARAYESAGRLDQAIQTSKEGADILGAAQRRDPASQQMLREAGFAFSRLGLLYRARAAGRSGPLAAADWRAALAAFDHATTLLHKLGSGTKLSDEDRERLAAMAAAQQECLRRLSPGTSTNHSEPPDAR